MAEEKKYIVKVTRVTGKGNRTYRGNEIVTEKQFPDGLAEQLLKDGALGEYKLAVKKNAEDKASLKQEIADLGVAVKAKEKELKDAKKEDQDGIQKELDELTKAIQNKQDLLKSM